MRIAIIGAGGVGGYFGARLQQAGADGHFVARGRHLAAMRSAGLRGESPLGDIDLPHVNATDNPADIGGADIVWLSVKRWHVDDARRAIWEKFVFLVGLSGSTTTMRETIGPIRSNPRSRRFLVELMRETVAVGRALGVSLPSDFAEQRLAFVDGLPDVMTSSMHHDLKAGKRLEVSWLSGGVAQLGEKAGVPTPMNRAVWEILTLHEMGAP